MTQGLDELKEITSAMNRSFKQGAASRQAEVDELQKRIDFLEQVICENLDERFLNVNFKKGESNE